MLYFAYGGNTNPYHIQKSYPDAQFLGIGFLPNYRLVFRQVDHTKLEHAYCDIEEYQKHSITPDDGVYGVIYEMPEDHMKKLDEQELVDVIYFRETHTVLNMTTNKEHTCQVYVMCDQTQPYMMPTSRYLKVVHIGYHHHKLPQKQFMKAINKAKKMIKKD